MKSRGVPGRKRFPPVDSGGDPVSGGFVPAGDGVAESLTAIRVAYRGPINSRRNTIYAIVPHYEDYVSLLVVCRPRGRGVE